MQSSIHEITSLEESLQKIGLKELLSELWTRLGGNSVERNIFEDNLKLLKTLESQRGIAVERISSIMQNLEKFQKQLSILRDETVTRLLVNIPVEVQLTNIKKALMRLQNNEVVVGVKKPNKTENKTENNTENNSENNTENNTENEPLCREPI